MARSSASGALGAEFAQQRLGGAEQRQRLGGEVVPRRGKAHRLRQATRRRQAELRRADEGEELEQIERRKRQHAEAPRGGARMAEIGRALARQPRRLGEAEQQRSRHRR